MTSQTQGGRSIHLSYGELYATRNDPRPQIFSHATRNDPRGTIGMEWDDV